MALGQAGVFPNHQDVGAVSKPGSVRYDSAQGQYLVAGGGENMWMTNDAFQFVWTKMSGDFTLAANIKFPAPGGNAHRKACLMVRQSLDANAAYVDVAVHGNGLTSLQFRDANGELTHEIQASVSAPERVRIEKHGDYISLSLAATNDTLRPAGVMCKHVFKEPFYVGLAVCAHDNKTIEQAAFAKVKLNAIPPGESKPVEPKPLKPNN